MTDEEYEEYIATELREADEEIEQRKCIPCEIVMKELKEFMESLERENQNYKKWRETLKLKRGENILRHTV